MPAAAMQVEAYLEAFADAFELHKYIRYQTRVVCLKPLRSDSMNGHAIPTGTSNGTRLHNGSKGSAMNGNGVAYSSEEYAQLAPPHWRISSVPADAEVSHTLSDFGILGFRAQCTILPQLPYFSQTLMPQQQQKLLPYLTPSRFMSDLCLQRLQRKLCHSSPQALSISWEVECRVPLHG